MGCVTSTNEDPRVDLRNLEQFSPRASATFIDTPTAKRNSHEFFRSTKVAFKDASGGMLDFGSRSHLIRSATGEDKHSKILVTALHKRSMRNMKVPADRKYVALVAHNEMKPSMMAFVKRHIAFFRACRVVTTGSTGTALEQKLGLKVTLKVSSGPLGGDQEIGALISQRQLGAVFFFRDPLSSHPHESDIQALARLCDVHNVMASTNPASGDTLVFALQHSQAAKDLLQTPQADAPHVDSDVVKAYKKRQAAVISSVAGNDKPAAITPKMGSAAISPKMSIPNPTLREKPTPRRSQNMLSPSRALTGLTDKSVKYSVATIELEYQLGASDIAMLQDGAEYPELGGEPSEKSRRWINTALEE